MTQETALALLKTGANVFLTGEPGSGKTHTINRYVAYLRDHGIEPAITASTGIAATHIGGMTVHSWSGIGIKKFLAKEDLDKLSKNKKLLSRIRHTSILIVDEISMLDARTLSALDAACRVLKKNQVPFGGMQLVIVGDFFQLPPISRYGEPPAQFAYFSESWQEASPTICYLTEQHRQEDAAFLSLLSALRNNMVTDMVHHLLSSRRVTTPPESAHTRLYSHNADVDRVNAERLALLTSEAGTFHMESRGSSLYTDQLKRGCISPEELALKIGARVIFTKNNFEDGFVNGTLGVVEGFADDGYPIVRTDRGTMIHVLPMEWSIEDGSKILAKIIQLPLRLAWAITVHKSQGMTLDSAIIDLSSAFEYGQGYVALSRIRTLSGLFLLGYNQRALEVHPQVLAADTSFKAQSLETEKTQQGMSPEENAKIEKEFILACGGTVQLADKKTSQSLKGKRQKRRGDRGNTYQVTLELFQEGKSIQEIASARNLVETTIAGHIEKLFIDGKLDRDQLMRLVSPVLSAGLPEIHQAFKESSDAKISPLFEKFNGKYSYSELRLARMLL